MPKNFGKNLVQKSLAKIKRMHSGEASGHDYWHSYRVWKTARKIGLAEGRKRKIDLLVVELAAILHDLSDYKLNGGDDLAGPRKAQEFLLESAAPGKVASKVAKIISEMNFPGSAGRPKRMSCIEGEIVRDADFLDAMGAVGIARTFAYGGRKGRPLFEPSIKPKLEMTKIEYRKRGATHTINHFYEKLLHLKNLLGTAAGKKIAKERHRRLQVFLSNFFSEWEGKS